MRAAGTESNFTEVCSAETLSNMRYLLPMRAVIFDFGGVVARFRPQQRLEALATATGLTTAAVHSALFTSGWDVACDRGEYTRDDAYEAALRHLGASLTYEEFSAAWTTAFEPDIDVLRLVRDVRQAGLKTGLLTDNGPVLRDALPVLLPGLSLYCDSVVFSCDVGVTKPDPRAFRRALSTLGIEPHQALFVDDSQVNVDAARKLGMTAHLFSDPTRLRLELEDLGVLSTDHR
ncbi:MAG TPA: HAD family phosphatase [Dehalococcoidia bacterium]|nr:HAD family phosphatase [Dehalococcoidia bacterium]